MAGKGEGVSGIMSRIVDYLGPGKADRQYHHHAQSKQSNDLAASCGMGKGQEVNTEITIFDAA